MDDTISRQAAIEALHKEIIKRRLLDDVDDGMLDEFDTEDILRKLPSAQPERKKGHWKLQKNGNAICSECGFVQVSAWDADGWDNFCHHCGADMRG